MNRLLPGALLMAVVIAGAVLPEAAQASEGSGGQALAGSVAPRALLAYIDPGSAGFIIVSALGFLAAIGYTARAYLDRLKRLIFRREQTSQENDTDQTKPDA